MMSLVAFDLGKRTVTSAILSETALKFWEVRTLSNEFDRALASVSGFVRWTIESFPVEAIALESVSPEDQSRAAKFTAGVIAIARSKGIPIHSVSRDELFQSFAHPPVRSRAELREIVSDLCPQYWSKKKDPLPLDAAAIGLHFQIEHLLAINPQLE